MSARFLPVGPRCLLVELADLDATLALFDALLADPLPGVAEVVPAARTLMITTDPGVAIASPQPQHDGEEEGVGRQSVREALGKLVGPNSPR